MKKIYVHKPYIILGVHRSGTTLMSNIFSRLGVFMGKNQNINKEAKFFFNLNNNALKENQATAYNFDIFLEKLKNKQFLNPLIERFEKKIKKQINYKFFGYNKLFNFFQNNHIKWGFKDPRSVLLYPVWEKIFPDAKYLIIIRNPIDVSMSIYYFEQKRYLKKLKKRPDLKFEMPLEKAFEVWKDFTEILIKLSEKENPNIISVKYEELKNTEVLKKIISFTDSETDIEKISEMIKINPSNYKKPEGYDKLIDLISNDSLTKKLYPDLKF